mmetsp:Transcript_25544/g.63286  ORF Transcript_25544/g.63286 Transcript_25544/m.63286 type:complete len:249 (-) Transcript_25544:415-1161(-)
MDLHLRHIKGECCRVVDRFNPRPLYVSELLREIEALGRDIVDEPGIQALNNYILHGAQRCATREEYLRSLFEARNGGEVPAIKGLFVRAQLKKKAANKSTFNKHQSVFAFLGKHLPHCALEVHIRKVHCLQLPCRFVEYRRYASIQLRNVIFDPHLQTNPLLVRVAAEKGSEVLCTWSVFYLEAVADICAIDIFRGRVTQKIAGWLGGRWGGQVDFRTGLKAFKPDLAQFHEFFILQNGLRLPRSIDP